MLSSNLTGQCAQSDNSSWGAGQNFIHAHDKNTVALHPARMINFQESRSKDAVNG